MAEKHITKEEFRRANEVCLFEYCRDEGISAGAKENYRSSQKYKTFDGDTVVLDPRHNGAYSNLECKPLSAVDALAKIEDITPGEAAERLLRYDCYDIDTHRDSYNPIQNPKSAVQKKDRSEEPKKPKHLKLPRSCGKKFKNAAAYLKQIRGIPQCVINELFDAGQVYQSEYKGHPNVVFRNPEGTFYEIRGASPDSDFHSSKGKGDGHFFYVKSRSYQKNGQEKVYVTESSIDTVSLRVIRADQNENALYVGMGGRIHEVMNRLLSEYRADQIILAVDNDEPGDQFRAKYPQLQTIRPIKKDWNMDLIDGNYAWELSATKTLHEKQRKAYELKQAGCTYDKIAKELGYNDRSAARKAVMAYASEEGLSVPKKKKTKEQKEETKVVSTEKTDTENPEELKIPEGPCDENVPPAFEFYIRLRVGLVDYSLYEMPETPQSFNKKTREEYARAYDAWMERCLAFMKPYFPHTKEEALRSYIVNAYKQSDYRIVSEEDGYRWLRDDEDCKNPVRLFLRNPLNVFLHGFSVKDFTIEDVNKKNNILWKNIFGVECGVAMRSLAVMYSVLTQNEKAGNIYMHQEQLLFQCRKYGVDYKEVPDIFTSPNRYFEYLQKNRKDPEKAGLFGEALKKIGYEIIRNGAIYRHGAYVALGRTASSEKYVIKKINGMNERITPITIEEDPTLCGEQNEAVSHMLTNRVSILSGGPGTGKSTTIVSFIKRLLKKEKCTVKVLAPTGAAANRLNEDFEKEHLDIEAETIDSFVTKRERFDCFVEGYYEFAIIDEASMINLPIFKRLLNTIDSTHLILSGDINQLPAVGCGDILGDMIRLEIPTFVLKENHRSTRTIIDNANRIINGNPTLILDEHFRFIESDDPVSDAAIEYTEGTMILSPYRRDAWKINQTIRARRHNTAYPEALLPGDKVVFTANKSQYGYFNGLTGVIREHTASIISVSTKKGLIKVPAHCAKDLTYAYAVTIHKSQGSEYRKAVILCPEGCGESFASRRLLYTAITRAQSEVVVIGSMSKFQTIIKTEPKERKTSMSLHLSA